MDEEYTSASLVPVTSPDGKEWPPRLWGNPATVLDCRVPGFTHDGKINRPERVEK
jgi:hypothetical protein